MIANVLIDFTSLLLLINKTDSFNNHFRKSLIITKIMAEFSVIDKNSETRVLQ